MANGPEDVDNKSKDPDMLCNGSVLCPGRRYANRFWYLDTVGAG